MTAEGRIFHITIAGEVGPATRQAFADTDVRVEDGNTVLSGELIDQASLHALLERIQALGLELIGVRID